MDERADAIEAWLLEHLADALGLDAQDIDPEQPFETYGLKSRDALALHERLEQTLDRKLPTTLAWEYPTPGALAVHLASEGARVAEVCATSQLEPDWMKGDRDLPRDEPIAIVGIGCRFPGASGPEAFWELLWEGGDAVRELPPERRALEALWWGEGDEVLPHRLGGFLDDIDRFDSDFFQISPREAVAIDPQQRQLLEVAWEAFEDAGIPPPQLEESRTGVFAGISAGEYAWLQVASGRTLDGYFGTGSALAIAANRVSYQFGLRGPSMAVDTACSSSLVAVHLACESLRRGECEMAVAAGANLILTPAVTLALHRAGALAPDGRCKSFDAAANGYVRSEGVGVVILEPLSRTQAAGRRIYAVVRGSAVNNDGRSNGLMAPSPKAQEALLQQAYASAGVSPASVNFVEAHGTGTPLGDPIEAQALAGVLCERRSGADCRVGSVKSQIGHLEAAAGIAGMIKVALSLHHRTLPKNLHFSKPSPHIDWTALGLRVQDRREPWPGAGPARAGVSSFGFGGTNAHAVLEQSPQRERVQTSSRSAEHPSLFALSARDPGALAALATTCALRARSGVRLADLAWSAAVHRTHHDHRLAVVAHTEEDLAKALDAHAANAPREGLVVGARCRPTRPRIAFLFTGQGSQWCGMGRDLAAEPGVFRQTLEECDAAIRSAADWSLWDTLHSDNDEWLERVDRIQPALFAVQLGLARWFQALGIEPAAVVGHSLGEVAAAVSIGALDVSDGARVICARSELVRRTAGRGGIAVLELSADEAEKAISPFGRRLGIAAVNAPRNVLVSGETEALDTLLRELDTKGIFARRVNVDYASHGPQMDPLLPDLRDALKGLTPRATALPLRSTALGRTLSGDRLDAAYWAQNLRNPVQFWSTAWELLSEGVTLWLELAPHPVLAPALRAALREHERSDVSVVGSLKRERPSTASLVRSLGELYCAGHPLDWGRIVPRGNFVPLPTYAWQGRRFFVEATPERANGSERAQSRASRSRHLYATRWRDAEPSDERDIANEHWVLLTDSGGVGKQLEEALVLRGAQVSRVPELGAHRGDPPHAVIHMSALDASGDGPLSGTQQAATWESALSTVQTLARAGHRNPPQLVFVTRGAQAGPAMSPSQATLWGLGKVVALEHPELDSRRIDLDPNPNRHPVEDLVRELLAKDAENEVAWRSGIRRVPRLERSPVFQKRDQPKIRADASYLITGGLGALGILISRRLVARGARHLVLLGRSEAGEAVARELEELRACGAEIRTVVCDVADSDSLARVLNRIESNGPKLAGVVHAAGVLEDGVLLRLDVERFNRALRPKIAGAYHLDQLTRASELDFFVLCSSAASMLGSPGQANYCAANAYLDALATQRRADGLPALSVQWGPWAGQGLAARDERRGARLEARGVRGLEPEAALDTLEFLLESDAVVAGVIDLDLRQWLQLFPSAAAWPLLTELATGLESAAPADPTLRREIESLPPESRATTLCEHLREEIARALERNPEEIDENVPLGDLGFDSLLAVELRNRLEGTLAAQLPSTLLFAHPTLAALVPALLSHLGLALPPDPANDLECDSELDLESLLARVEQPESTTDRTPRERADAPVPSSTVEVP